LPEKGDNPLEHILRDAIPEGEAFLKQPAPAQFARFIAKLDEVLDKEADHVAPQMPMRAAVEALKLDPPATRKHFEEWKQGKQIPLTAISIVRRILQLFRERGIQAKETASQRKKRDDQERNPAGPPADFGNLISSPALATAEEALAHSQWNNKTLPRMQAVPAPVALSAPPPGDPIEAFGLFRPDANPSGFAALMLLLLATFHPSEIAKILLPVGVTAEWVAAWAHACRQNALSAVQWPDAFYQLRIVKQLLACVLVLEMRNHPPTPTLVMRWLKYATHLLSTEDANVLAKALQALPPSPHGGGEFGSQDLWRYSVGVESPPKDPILLATIRNGLDGLLTAHLRTGVWS
jgi:hypothetical protein